MTLLEASEHQQRIDGVSGRPDCKLLQIRPNSPFDITVMESIAGSTALFHKYLNSYSIFPLFVTEDMKSMATKALSRLDLRIPREQKEHFEEVLEIGGFRSLTDFLISAASEKADAIMEKHNNWLSSEDDRKTFFAALMNPPKPNARLKKAMKNHFEYTSK
jgi:uncharacterized protein (DUF1778 family)